MSVQVVALVAVCMAAWLINNWIRARHGYPISDDWGRNLKRETTEEAAKLSAENAELKAVVARLEGRLANVERIVTDESYRLDHEIERLRGPVD